MLAGCDLIRKTYRQGRSGGQNPGVNAVWGEPMIRSELLLALGKENPDLRADEIERVVDVFFDEVGKRLAEGGRVELRGFGAFSTRTRDPRKGRNPRTGESVEVPGKRVPYFKPGKEMHNRLNTA